jgi:two-component system sensor histidine kinase/response regulator
MDQILNVLAEAIPGLIIQVDEDGIFMEVISNDDDLLYTDKENIAGKSIHSVMGPMSDTLFNLVKKTINSNVPQNIEYEMPVISGKNLYFEGRCVPMKHKIDGKKYVTFIARDVTEKKKNLDEIRLSEERFRSIYENAYVAIGFADKNGYILSVNPAFARLLEYSEAELKTKHFSEITYPDDYEREVGYFKEIVEGKIEKYKIDKRYITGTGKIIWVDLTLSVIRDTSTNEPLHFIGVVTDITEQRLLKEINTTKDTFFSIIAHDLQSPLTGIIGICDILKNNFNDLDDKQREQIINSLYDGTRNAHSLLKNLLEWARSQRGLIEYKPSKLNLKKILSDVIQLLNPLAKQKDIEIHNHIQDSYMIFTDIQILYTVLRNIIGNSLKYTHNNGSIDIRIQQEESDVVISIEDTGIGMSEEYLDEIFQIEIKKSMPGTSKEKGTGLGLILCKELIDIYEGRIWANSKLNEGTTFYFTIPLFKENLKS